MSTGGRLERVRAELRRFLEVFALCGFAVVQPLLDTLGRSPEFFLFREATRTDIVLLGLAAVVVPAVVLWAGGALAGLAGARARSAAHVATLGVLVAVFALPHLKDAVSTRGLVLLVPALAAGALACLAYVRFDALRSWVRYLSVAPPLFLALFLLASPVSDLVLGGEPEARAGTPESDTPVVMVVLDELPLVTLLDGQGEIDGDLYPNLARLAGDSTWYRNATGVSVSTVLALPAMLSGRYPDDDVAPIARNHDDTLFTLLGRTHDVVASEVVTKLCPRWCTDPAAGGVTTQRLVREAARVWRQIVTPQRGSTNPAAAVFVEGARFLTAREARSATPEEIFERTQPRRFAQFVEAVREPSGERPPFYYLHTLMPHQPWRFSPNGVRVAAGDLPLANGERWVDQPWIAESLRQRHLLQTAYTDRLLGTLLDRLDETGIYDDALVVVTADHGVRFDAGAPGRHYEEDGADELLWVPLFVKAPGQQAGVVDDREWEHVDLLPTMADHLGLEVPWEVDGVSAVATRPRAPRERITYSYDAESHDVDDARWFPDLLERSPSELLAGTDAVGDLFGPGPYGSLVGRRVADLDVPEGGGTVQLEHPRRFGAVAPGHRAVPAIVEGTVSGVEAGDDRWVAVAVNGRVAGLSQLLRHDGATWFEAVVDDSLFRWGPNEVEVLEVSGPAGEPRLARLRRR